MSKKESCIVLVDGRSEEDNGVFTFFGVDAAESARRFALARFADELDEMTVSGTGQVARAALADWDGTGSLELDDATGPQVLLAESEVNPPPAFDVDSFRRKED